MIDPVKELGEAMDTVMDAFIIVVGYVAAVILMPFWLPIKVYKLYKMGFKE